MRRRLLTVGLMIDVLVAALGRMDSVSAGNVVDHKTKAPKMPGGPNIRRKGKGERKRNRKERWT